MNVNLTKEEISTIKFSIKKSYNNLIKSHSAFLNEEDEKIIVNLTKVFKKLNKLKVSE